MVPAPAGLGRRVGGRLARPPARDTLAARAPAGIGGRPLGALVRGSGRHCAGRGKAPARAWCRCGWWAGGVRCRKVATLHQAPSGSGAQSRERRAALSSVALSPRGVARCAPSSQTRSVHALSAPQSADWSARRHFCQRRLGKGKGSGGVANRSARLSPRRAGLPTCAGDREGAAPTPPAQAAPLGLVEAGRSK